MAETTNITSRPFAPSSVNSSITFTSNSGSVKLSAEVFKYDQQNKKQPIYDWGNDEYTASARGRKIVIGLISIPILGHDTIESLIGATIDDSVPPDPSTVSGSDAFSTAYTKPNNSYDALDIMDGGFKITITIGNSKSFSTHKVIHDVQFTSRSLTIDANTGAPLAEVLSFYGKMGGPATVTK